MEIGLESQAGEAESNNYDPTIFMTHMVQEAKHCCVRGQDLSD